MDVEPGVTGGRTHAEELDRMVAEDTARAVSAYRCPFCGGKTAVTWQAGLPIFHCPACDEVAGP